MLLFIAFATILTITFGTVALVTSSSRSQRAIDKRLIGLGASHQAGIDEPQAQILLKLEPTESSGWLDVLLHEYRLTQILEQQIIQADIKISVSKLVFASIA